jgi:hypothetical protein
MATVQELNRLQLGIAVGAYIAAYSKLYELSINPADASQAEWEADSSDHWTYEQLLVDAQDAESLISVVDTQSEAQQDILDYNAAIIIKAFQDNVVKEYIDSVAQGWVIYYDSVTETIYVTGLVPAIDPTSISPRIFHVKCDDGTLSPGLIATWGDLSGFGNDLEASGALRPSVITPDGGVIFTSAQGMVSSSDLPFAGFPDLTIFAVIQNDVELPGILMEAGADYTADNAFAITTNDGTNGDITIGDNGDVGLDTRLINAPLATPILIRGDIFRSNTGKDCDLFINGSNLDGTSPDTADNTNNFIDNILYVGSRNNTSNFFKGIVFEIIIYRRKLTAFEIGGIESYLKAKYSL